MRIEWKEVVSEYLRGETGSITICFLLYISILLYFGTNFAQQGFFYLLHVSELQ